MTVHSHKNIERYNKKYSHIDMGGHLSLCDKSNPNIGVVLSTIIFGVFIFTVFSCFHPYHTLLKLNENSPTTKELRSDGTQFKSINYYKSRSNYTLVDESFISHL